MRMARLPAARGHIDQRRAGQAPFTSLFDLRGLQGKGPPAEKPDVIALNVKNINPCKSRLYM
jgi:hypothetical protein